MGRFKSWWHDLGPAVMFVAALAAIGIFCVVLYACA